MLTSFYGPNFGITNFLAFWYFSELKCMIRNDHLHLYKMLPRSKLCCLIHRLHLFVQPFCPLSSFIKYKCPPSFFIKCRCTRCFFQFEVHDMFYTFIWSCFFLKIVRELIAFTNLVALKCSWWWLIHVCICHQYNTPNNLWQCDQDDR